MNSQITRVARGAKCDGCDASGLAAVDADPARSGKLSANIEASATEPSPAPECNRNWRRLKGAGSIAALRDYRGKPFLFAGASFDLPKQTGFCAANKDKLCSIAARL